MSIFNVRIANLRAAGYEDLEHWCSDENNVYVGRRSIVFVKGRRYPPNNSEFANLFTIGKDGDRDTVIQKYETWIRDKLVSDPSFRDRLLALEGKNLGCWCAPEKCHAEVILQLIQELK